MSVQSAVIWEMSSWMVSESESEFEFEPEFDDVVVAALVVGVFEDVLPEPLEVQPAVRLAASANEAANARGL